MPKCKRKKRMPPAPAGAMKLMAPKGTGNIGRALLKRGKK
jgi:hypothetical protein